VISSEEGREETAGARAEEEKTIVLLHFGNHIDRRMELLEGERR